MMENKEQDPIKAKSAIDNPKPTDEVQLTIETVTPDTHQTVPQTAVDSKDAEEKTKPANDNEENKNEDTELEEQVVDTDNKEDNDQEEVERAKDAENTKGDTEEGDDERDKIETVAP